MSIDDRLRDTFNSFKYAWKFGEPTEATLGEMTERTKQAFADEGYTLDLYRKHFNDAFIDSIKREAGLMTGQEFFDRFRNELDELPIYHDDQIEILRAARIAAGLEEK